MAQLYKLKRDAKGNIVRVRVPAYKQNIPHQTLPRAPKQAKKRPFRPFRLLDLPPELRNNVYEKILEIYPIAHLSRFTSDQNLLTDCRMVSINKQVRQEFLSSLAVYGPIICTPVRNLNFSHIIQIAT